VGAATGSSAADSHPSAGTSEKSLPGPAANDPYSTTPHPSRQPVPAPFTSAGPSAKTGAHWQARPAPLLTEGSHERSCLVTD